VHYEAEIVIRINRLGKRIQSKFAPKYYAQYTIGIDFTARDVQKKLKEKGLPWEKAKAFDSSAVCGDWLDVEGVDLANLRFELKKNGEIVQSGNTKDMLYPINDLVEHASEYFTLKIGDLIFTGTPEGVGKVESGDVLEGFIEGKQILRVRVK
jgi:2-keto-4-pentenoate hydratase/2-oxohepta-3-ene-1,7-dioic acid hydratase in catechol pathway